jgi:hypothetical protein
MNRSITILALALLGGCATVVVPEHAGLHVVEYTCPASTMKVCTRPANELICECSRRQGPLVMRVNTR